MDLRQILDKILEVGEEEQIIASISKLEKKNIQLKNECGSCWKWMTSLCQREKTHKVSCGETPCRDFSLDSFSEKLISQNSVKIQNLKNGLTKNK